MFGKPSLISQVQVVGECPAIESNNEVLGRCKDECQTDTNCTLSSQKCCFNGCGYLCTEVLISTPAPCPEVHCRIGCPFGYQQDVNGCSTCACYEQTVIHDGACPLVSEDTVGVCVESCQHDGNCTESQKCCTNGCGHQCVQAVLPEYDEGTKTGECPIPDHDEIGLCSEECSTDRDCTGDLKCCSNGCGHQCIQAVQENPEHECPAIRCMMWCPHGNQQDEHGCDMCLCSRQTVIHAGECPMIEDGVFGVCSETCNHDGNCTETQKCCSNGCGHSCMEAVQPDPVLASCPLVNTDQFGLCVEDCSIHSDCNELQICCPNGCGHQCMAPINVVCPEIMCAIYCEFGYQRDQNGCDTCSCLEDSMVKEGSCPVIEDGMIGLCVESCSSDGECSSDMKCCSTGCGHTCIQPVKVLKPGHCPAVITNYLGLCVEDCFDDNSCTDSMKCCSNGCGHSCQQPVKVLKPGTCPVLTQDADPPCLLECYDDGDCADSWKCCQQGCGHTCVKPLQEFKEQQSEDFNGALYLMMSSLMILSAAVTTVLLI